MIAKLKGREENNNSSRHFFINQKMKYLQVKQKQRHRLQTHQ